MWKKESGHKIVQAWAEAKSRVLASIANKSKRILLKSVLHENTLIHYGRQYVLKLFHGMTFLKPWQAVTKHAWPMSNNMPAIPLADIWSCAK